MAIDSADSSEIEARILEAVSTAGLRPSRMLALAETRLSRSGRRALLVELEDGTRVKARWIESPEAAEELVARRARLEVAFAPVLSLHHNVILEVWIDGDPLPQPPTARDLEESGALLGRLHAMPVDEAPRRVDLAEWANLAKDRLTVLAREGEFGPEITEPLFDVLVRGAGRRVPVVPIHRDFCGENMVRDRHGDLRVIDNEWQSSGPAGFDLGYMFCRWPLRDEGRECFLAAYRSECVSDPGPLAFWNVAIPLVRTGYLPATASEKRADIRSQLREHAAAWAAHAGPWT